MTKAIEYGNGDLRNIAKREVKGRGRLLGWGIRITETNHVVLIATYRHKESGAVKDVRIAL